MNQSSLRNDSLLTSDSSLAMAVSVTTAASARVEPKSAHVSDSSIQPFLQQDFDPADYLNNALPSLSVSTTNRGTQSAQYGRSVPLPELSSQLQSLLSQLNAQTSRLSTVLTQLTDEIIRSGGRLAYEVELLRGETIGLTDSLENGLKKDIELFAPNKDATQAAQTEDEDQSMQSTDPEYLNSLKTLTSVRSRLDNVIKVFDSAMQWPLAPSELSLTSSLISVSSNPADDREREEKGKAYTAALHSELNALIGSGNDIASLEVAAARIEGLRALAEVWRGTAEEKARLKIVEALQRPVEERLRVLEQGRVGSRVGGGRGVDLRYGSMSDARGVSEGGYGFLQGLRKLGNDVYLE